jgi:hypothetical protein
VPARPLSALSVCFRLKNSTFDDVFAGRVHASG